MFQAQSAIEKCVLCGQAYPPTTMVLDLTDGEPLFICPDCYQFMTTCRTCETAQYCTFETDPSPIPKFIQRQYRQGPMTSVIQEKNPERIAITCQKDCECFSEEKGCLREKVGWCNKYAFILRPR